jgi:hypothetical protein
MGLILILFLLFVACSIIVLWQQAIFFKLYSKKGHNELDLDQAIRLNPNAAPVIAFGFMRHKLELLWGMHQDRELNKVAKRVRISFYASVLVLSLVVVSILFMPARN